MGLIDFLDEGDIDVQEAFYNYLYSDTHNVFLNSLHAFMTVNFNYFKEYIKGVRD